MSIRTLISMKALICGRVFSLRIITRSIHTSDCMNLVCKCKIINTTEKMDGDTIFLCENSNWEKSRGEGKSTIIHRFTGITCMYWDWDLMKSLRSS